MSDLRTTFWIIIGLMFVLMFIFSPKLSGVAGDEVMLTIDFGDGTKRTFLTTKKDDLRAWDLLQQANAVYGIPLEIEGKFEPKVIGNMANEEGGRKWNFYIDGRLQNISPFEAKLFGGEKVLFKFE